jgi:D-beta-D-heptose 7-phosphate kinase/D-beta-D-heptose 1-phosphate adenosyltransferase
MRIALAQLKACVGALDSLIKQAVQAIEEASRRGSRWVLLPDMWSCGFSARRMEDAARRKDKILDDLRGIARRLHIGIVSPLPEEMAGAIYDSAYVIGAKGEVLGGHRKTHIMPGTQAPDRGPMPRGAPLVLDIPGARAGVTVGDEIFFPELFRLMALRGIDLLWVCSLLQEGFLEEWRVLLRARAVESSVYVVAVNACGETGSTKFLGHSMGVDPKGDVVVEGADVPEVLTVDVDLDFLADACSSREPSQGWRSVRRFITLSMHHKTLAAEEAAKLIEKVRRRGARVVFTNGCFDILHRGHVSLLEQASTLGDLLVVGINSDDSVRRIKGPGRPINPLEDRCAVLASLACVDLVVPFEEDTPMELIRRLRPDVLVKGQDWKEEEIVGAEVVRERGGEVVRIPLVQGVSTTGLLERIKKEKEGP